MPRKLLSIVIALALLTPLSAFALAVSTVPQGGTGSSTLTGILIGNGTSPVKSLRVGTGLTLTGTTLTVTGVSDAASSTLLGDSNTFSGNDTFSNTITGSVTGNAGTATKLFTARAINGVNFDGSGPITINAASSSLLTDFNTFAHALTASITGLAGTATALAANGTNCSAGSYALGVDVSGNSEGCTVAAVGTVTSVSGTWPIISSGGATPTITFGGLSTTSAAVVGNIPYFSGVNTFANVATGTLSASGPVAVTAGRSVVGGAAAISITQSSATVDGYLSAVNFNIFNNKIGTSTAHETAGQLAYFTTTSGTPALLTGIATSSETCTAPLSCTAHTVLTGGGAITISTAGTWSGNAGTASALAANGTNCSAGNAPLGIDASGNAEGCFTVAAFGYPFIGDATSTLINFSTGLKSASTTLTGNFVFANATGTNATTTNFFATLASSTNLYGANLSPCTGTNALTWTGGLFTCTAQPQGTVTAVSVASANGFTGSSSGGATPALTLTTSISGLLAGNGTAISAAALTNFPTQAANTIIGNLTGGTAAPTAFASSSLFTGAVGNLGYFSGTGLLVGTSSLTLATNQNLGVGSSTPWALFSVGPNGLTYPSFAIGSSSNQTQFQVTQGGETAVCESKPGYGPTAATSTTYTLDWTATCPTVTYNTGASATTITLINATTTNMAGSRKLVMVCNGGSAAGALTWKGPEWIGTAPVQTTTANQCDVWSFFVSSATSSPLATPTYKVVGAMSAGFQ